MAIQKSDIQLKNQHYIIFFFKPWGYEQTHLILEQAYIKAGEAVHTDSNMYVNKS